MGSAPPVGAMEEDMFPERDYRSPLVPIGALATAGVLIAGLHSFKQGKSQRSQMLMRARVLMQGATVALMVGTVYYQGQVAQIPSSKGN